MADNKQVSGKCEKLKQSDDREELDHCPEHNEVIDLYCKDDDTACCKQCVRSKHGLCEDVVYLPKLVRRVLKDTDIEGLKRKLQELIRRLGSTKITQETTLSDIEDDRDTCLKEVDDHYKEMSTLLEKILKTSKDRIQQTFERLRSELHEDNGSVLRSLVELKESGQQLDNDNDVRLFLGLDKHQRVLKEAEAVLSKSHKNLEAPVYHVTSDQLLKNLLRKLQSQVTELLEKPAAQVVDISIPEQQKPSDVVGGCVLEDGSVVLADGCNMMIKRLDGQSLKVVEYCKMQGEINDMCYIGDGYVAVLHDFPKLVLVSVNPRLSTTRFVNLKRCFFRRGRLAYYNGEFFINDGSNTLEVYSVKGDHLRRIQFGLTRKRTYMYNFFLWPRNDVVCSDSGDRLYVVDDNACLITLDREGNVLDSVLDKDMNHSITAMYLGGSGGLIITRAHTNDAIHVCPAGNIIAKVPMSSGTTPVCYDRVRKRLFVSQSDGNKLQICNFRRICL